MSLLMKALEKAAKDRGEPRPEPAAAPSTAAPASAAAAPAPSVSHSPARSELSLEPMSAAATEPTIASRADSPARPAPPGPARTAASSAAAQSAAPAREQAQAATVFQASTSRASGGGPVEYLRAHPVVALGALAGLFILGFGGYVYVQIFNPGLLTAKPPIASKGFTPPPQAQAPAPTPPVEPLASAPVLKEAAAESAATPAADTAKANPRTAPLPAAEETARSSNAIVVSPGSPGPVLNPQLTEAYAALQSNQPEAAQGLYQNVLSSEPRSTDALLGLAAIAVRRGNSDEAIKRYIQILDLEPRHELAQAGLLALLGRADPLAAESRLRNLIARAPSGYLYFTLGNLYADQSQWAGAQQAYFQAHHLEPSNPDYAYNLAVGLEHVSQPKLALGFYRRALELAAAKGRANFDPAPVRERVARLTQQVE
jgi:tetratricopeptide (TPR) repeat protein